MRKKTSCSAVGSAGARLVVASAVTARRPVSSTGDVARTGVDGEAGDVDARHVGDRQRPAPRWAVSVARPRPRTTVSARLTCDGAVEVVDARVSSRLLAARQLAVDRRDRVRRAARRRSRESGIEPPGVGPGGPGRPGRVGRAGQARRPATARRRRRRGRASRGSPASSPGSCRPPHAASAGKHSAGAPASPENTWFHTPLRPAVEAGVAHVELLLRPVDDRLPSNRESAMKPPLAN